MSGDATLSKPAFDRARVWLCENARPIDLALFRYRFEQGPAADVALALAGFQNRDGGFGKGLEPDFRLPDSSPMATSVALQTIDEIGLAGDDPLVTGALTYLLETWDEARRGWVGVPLAVNDHPHAPWWQRTGDSPPWGNPDAELVAAFARRPDQIPAERLDEMLGAALEELAAIASPLPVYTALCFLRLARAAAEPARSAIEKRLRADARSILDLSPEARATATHAQSWWLAPRPDSPLAEALGREVAEDLRHVISRQDPDGYWPPGWSWGPGYPEAWQTSRRDWCGHETVQILSALAAWGLAPAAG